ncbi:tetratricopeptide repeat protein, partial [Methylobacterium trifolii]
RAAGEPGWSVLFLAFLREALKTNPRAEVAFVTVRLAGLREAARRIEDGLDALAAGQATIKDDTGVIRAGLDELLRRVSREESVPLDTLRAILTAMGEVAQAADAAEIEQRLKAKAAEFRDLAERLSRLSNDDPEVVRLRQASADALGRGRFAEADAHLAAAEARDLAGLAELESISRHKRLSAAQSRAERASAAKLRTNPDAYAEAATHYAEAARIVAPADGRIAYEYAHRQALVLLDLGRDFGRNVSLKAAVEVFRDVLRSSSDDASYWAMAQNNLGNALRTLGERESGTGRLEEAVSAYRAALEELTRERVPLNWAATQNNLGTALATLGGRESGPDRLEEAVSAYRAALEEWTRERVPLDWAGTQNNLGAALQTLGGRESGTDRLEEAVAAYRAALEEWTRERVPLDWAATQNNLGTALATLGGRESGTARLEEAVSAYRAALEEYTRERVPLDWAMSLGNQGTALSLLADRRGDVAMARRALEQIETALETFATADHAPYSASYRSAAAKAQAVVQRLGG